MARRALRERLARDIGTWLTDGLISGDTHALLRERYEAPHFGVATAIKYLGFSGAFFAFAGVLGLIAAFAASEWLAALFAFSVGTGLTGLGIALSRDKLARYGNSSKMLLAFGVAVASAGVAVALHALGAPPQRITLIAGAFVLPVLFALAYRFANTMLLVLGLLGFFHWVGSASAMAGRSTYELFIEDERAMAAAALAVIAAGVFHELRLRESTGRFYQAYQVLGLIYLDLSLLTLSLTDRWGPAWFWIAVFAALGGAQVVLGARLHSAIFVGFGVTALSINFYTRYFELFWERMRAGSFFLLGGAMLFVAGLGAEFALKRQRETTS